MSKITPADGGFKNEHNYFVQEEFLKRDEENGNLYLRDGQRAVMASEDFISGLHSGMHEEVDDAANLIMPLVFCMAPQDPRMLSTLDAMLKPPDQGGLVSDGLVYRYNTQSGVDGLDGEEGTFNMCTFWLVEALTRAGRLDEARLMFEQMLSYANHLGLYAEETGMHGEALGNFPFRSWHRPFTWYEDGSLAYQ